VCMRRAAWVTGIAALTAWRFLFLVIVDVPK
jgi:hypothetical protein